jgi:DNA polymerase alpha-associated DNA helicase A
MIITFCVPKRMHESICAFPSKTLYGSELKAHPSVASHLLHDLPNAQAKSEDDENEFLKTPIVFFDTAGCEYFERLDGDADEGSRSNENEATIVSNWVDKLVCLLFHLWSFPRVSLKPLLRLAQLEVGILPEQIAILTPYQAQVTLLNSLLRTKHGQGLEIGTVDGMQGREKEAVIISLVRSNDKVRLHFPM